MKNIKLVVKTKSKSYPIYFGNNILGKTNSLIKKNLPEVKKICIIFDNKLSKQILRKFLKSLKGYEIIIFKLSSSEKNKNFKVANRIIEKLLSNNFNRSDCIISLGGGVLGDLSAFVANLTKRGLKLINIPTTLLSQVDASIGGKTAVNSDQGKNLIGTYYQPDFVISDVSILKTLPKREIVSGYGEILKHSLIRDRNFFFWLLKNGKKIINRGSSNNLTNAIVKSCKIKSAIVNKDEKEKNLRMILNFGHTFGHGFERAKNFSKKLNHGEAVLLGMLIASDLSHKKKQLCSNDLKLIKDHYKNLKLPMNIDKVFKKRDVSKIINFMQKHKKNLNKKINLILLKKIGQATKPKNFMINSKEIKNFLNTYYY